MKEKTDQSLQTEKEQLQVVNSDYIIEPQMAPASFTAYFDALMRGSSRDVRTFRVSGYL